MYAAFRVSFLTRNMSVSICIFWLALISRCSALASPGSSAFSSAASLTATSAPSASRPADGSSSSEIRAWTSARTLDASAAPWRSTLSLSSRSW